jgi:lipid II:glycine glycyltransferase (peptidoglycan interpeptide bridge formation enzyme)
MIASGLGFMAMAEWDNKIIAGTVFLTYRDTLYYKFNASDGKYLPKRPNNLIIWETIQYACLHGFKFYDLGRCTPEEESLRIFKSYWGAKEVALPYYYYPVVKGITAASENSARHAAMRFFSRIMPQAAFRVVGSILYKHLG